MFRSARWRSSLLFFFAACTSASVFGHSGDRIPQSYCTPAALKALIAVPKLEYNCGENEEASLNSYERLDAVRDYQDDLRSLFAKQSWWNISAEELNACAITNEA